LATLLAAICFEMRGNQIFDELLSIAIPFRGVKEYVDYLAWRPGQFIWHFTALYVAGFLSISLLIKTFSLIYRTSISFAQSLIIAGWATSPFLLLIPVVVIFHRILGSDFVFFLCIFGLISIGFWYIFRLFKILRVVFRISWAQTLVVFGGLAILAMVILLTYYDRSFDTFEHLDYVVDLCQSDNYLRR